MSAAATPRAPRAAGRRPRPPGRGVRARPRRRRRRHPADGGGAGSTAPRCGPSWRSARTRARSCAPGSDIDVMLLHRGGRRSAPDADAAGGLWYPLWDAGFVLGQSVRSVKEALAVADEDLDALTALLDVRLVAGDTALVDELVQRVRQLAPRRRDRLVDTLADAAAARLHHPGPIAEMLEPDLKSGAGGLRDLQTPGWAGWSLPTPAVTVGPHDGRAWDRGIAILVERGYLQAGDPERLREAPRPAARRPRRAPPDHRRPFRPAGVAGAGRGQPVAGDARRRRADARARGGGTRRRLDRPRAVGAVAGGGGGPDPVPQCQPRPR